MKDKVEILHRVRESAKKNRLYLSHALRQMNRPSRMISPEEVRNVIENGEVIEDYPEDARGHSCLIMGRGASNRPIHVVCTPKQDYLAVITAYIPDAQEWLDDFTKRKKS